MDVDSLEQKLALPYTIRIANCQAWWHMPLIPAPWRLWQGTMNLRPPKVPHHEGRVWARPRQEEYKFTHIHLGQGACRGIMSDSGGPDAQLGT